MSGVGRVRRRMAALLNRCIPEIGGTPVRWLPEKLYPAQGRYRSDWRMDVRRWEAAAVRADNSKKLVWTGGCWESMTECLKAGGVALGESGDLYPEPLAAIAKATGQSA